MEELKLIARIAGERVALPAGLIESVVEIDAITPVPRAQCHVAGLAALRSRVLTIIDSYAALDCGRRPEGAGLQAVVVALEGHLYGLLVDEVEDVAEIAGAPDRVQAGLAYGWARAALGYVEHEGRALLLVDPARLIAGPAQVAA